MSSQSTLKIRRRPTAYRSYLRQIRYVKAHKGKPHLKKLLGLAILRRALRSGVQRLKDLRGPNSFYNKAARPATRSYNPFIVAGRAMQKGFRSRTGRRFLNRMMNNDDTFQTLKPDVKRNIAITRNRAATFLQQSLARLAIRRKMRVPFT